MKGSQSKKNCQFAIYELTIHVKTWKETQEIVVNCECLIVNECNKYKEGNYEEV